MPLLQGLIFDLDGTLINSAPDLGQAINAVLATYGRRPLTQEEVKHAVGDGMTPFIQRAFLTTGGLPENFNSNACFQAFIAQYRALPPDSAQIYPQAKETLAFYHDKKIKLGICTNKQEAATIRLLEQLDLARYFAFIAGGDTFPEHKPHPNHVRGVIKALDVSPAHCVMIGDSMNDVSAAKGARIPSIVITHGYADDYAQLGGDRLISGFEEMPQALEALGFHLV